MSTPAVDSLSAPPASGVLQSPGAAIHDATTGFHDIKPLPLFHPFPWGWMLVTIVILGVGYIIWRLYTAKPESFIQPTPPTPPDETALHALRDLKRRLDSGETVFRSLAASLSFVLRSYLEQALDFPAAEETPREVMQSLSNAFKAQLPTLPPALGDDTIESVRRILRSCEQLAFGTDLIAAGDQTTRAAEAIERAIAVITQTSEWLRKEADRTRPVVPDLDTPAVEART